MLHVAGWYLVTSISRQPVGPICKVQAVLNNTTIDFLVSHGWFSKLQMSLWLQLLPWLPMLPLFIVCCVMWMHQKGFVL